MTHIRKVNVASALVGIVLQHRDLGTRRGSVTLVMMRFLKEQSWTGREGGSEQGWRGET